MKAVFLAAFPYADDVLNLPVANVESAIPYYQTVFGMELESREEAPVVRAVLFRDSAKIGFAENGGDPSQEGAVVRVDSAETAWNELKTNGLDQEAPNFRVDTRNGKQYKVFFVIAPDGLCYCFSEALD